MIKDYRESVKKKNMKSGYRETDKICEIISSSPSILQMMCRFGIPFGVGENTVRQVCEESNVHTGTFLAVANQMNGVPISGGRDRIEEFKEEWTEMISIFQFVTREGDNSDKT